MISHTTAETHTHTHTHTYTHTHLGLPGFLYMTIMKDAGASQRHARVHLKREGN